MTKIGSPGGPIKPSIPEFENNQTTPSAKEALPEKIVPQAGNPSSATEAKGVMDSQAELMKAKLQENLKSAGDAGTALPDKWSPDHPSVPLHPDIYLPGSANAEKWQPTHPSAPLHPDVHLPGTAMPDKWSPGTSSPPHPNVELPISAPPSKLVNDKPATRLDEEKEKK